jgi:hypothetical protein
LLSRSIERQPADAEALGHGAEALVLDHQAGDQA